MQAAASFASAVSSVALPAVVSASQSSTLQARARASQHPFAARARPECRSRRLWVCVHNGSAEVKRLGTRSPWPTRGAASRHRPGSRSTACAYSHEARFCRVCCATTTQRGPAGLRRWLWGCAPLGAANILARRAEAGVECSQPLGLAGCVRVDCHGAFAQMVRGV